MLFLVGLLKEFWKEIAIGVFILCVLGYIKLLHIEIEHYKKKASEQEVVLEQLKQDEEKLKQANASITKQHEAVLRNFDAELSRNQKAIQERIDANEELKRVRISFDAVRLFNESKRDPSVKESTTAIQGDDAKTDSSETVSLTAIFKVSAENDSNHWSCVKQVEEWQNFWIEFVSNVKLAEHSQ